jgi:hypothetical protein
MKMGTSLGHSLLCKITFALLTVVSVSVGTALAQGLRCPDNEESLDHVQAVERRLWAWRCSNGDPLYRPGKDTSASPVDYASEAYPVFGKITDYKTQEIEIWPAPVDRYASCERPEDVYPFMFCIVK